MTYRTLLSIAALQAGALAFAQAPAPPAPPEPPAAARPAPAPLPAIAPLPPLPPDLDSLDIQVDIQEKVEAARAQAEAMRGDLEARRGELEAARDMAMRNAPDLARLKGLALAPQISTRINARTFGQMNEDRLYQRGQSALDGKRWDDAIDAFTQAAAKGGPRADGALYWKAYALRKVGKNSEAMAAIAELRKTYPASRWLDDAKALELDLGKPVSPEAETDEELKLLALNGIMMSDPERAIPLVESQLKSSASPRVKRNALFVLAQSGNPKAQAVVEQIARGGGNPDLQVKAIQYLNERRRANAGQILQEIYSSSNDVEVKRAVLNAYVSNRDKDRLLAVAKSEKSPELRGMAISYLGGVQGGAELWQLYASETTSEGKEQILSRMWGSGNADKLLEVARTEKDPKLRRLAIQILASQKDANTSGALAQMYQTEQDPQIKNTILDSLYGQRNATALISLARAEKDSKMKLRIVERISNLASRNKDAASYLEELLK
ncbi:MAG: HEAT repeat domain-containing protein [Acidobacteria bacterium]|nr:HEAT repeat domain-containing protein [Acidobacteriota bacterium]